MAELLQADSHIQNPNLQQIPARDKELGPAIRSLFIPEEAIHGVVLTILSKSLGW